MGVIGGVIAAQEIKRLQDDKKKKKEGIKAAKPEEKE
jgi:hypothetical protein